ncbi:probable transcription-associated protein 1 [Harpegnathos saltator]|uniref:probable transcription-associated protein 1 n=1 Tax=Harpegnathos saltator TaxID=610380 RepID=UPI000DBEF292|nr:probable transcription-associated protein 1 [Harpegnathos saltator]
MSANENGLNTMTTKTATTVTTPATATMVTTSATATTATMAVSEKITGATSTTAAMATTATEPITLTVSIKIYEGSLKNWRQKPSKLYAQTLRVVWQQDLRGFCR